MSGFTSPNYTQVPNDLFDALMSEMNGSELKVVLAIVRQTIGYHRERVVFSQSKIAKMTGLSYRVVIEAAEQAEKRGLIRRLNKDNGSSAEWELIVTCEEKSQDEIEATCDKKSYPPLTKSNTTYDEKSPQLGLKKDKESKEILAKTAPAIQSPTEQTPNPEPSPDQQPPKPDNGKPGKRVRGGGKPVNKNAPMESLAVFGHENLPMAEAFIEKAGQVYWPTNGQKAFWFMVLNDWQRRGFGPDDVRAAVDEMRKQRLTIGSPKSLTNVMMSMAGNKSYQAEQTPIYHRSE